MRREPTHTLLWICLVLKRTTEYSKLDLLVCLRLGGFLRGREGVLMRWFVGRPRQGKSFLGMG